jgi:hypothetical protein
MDSQPRAQSGVAPRHDERGVALILALLFTVIVAGITLTGTLMLRSHIQTNRTAWASKSQALQVARSGLAEGVAWLRRQTSQPVLTFAPQLDTSASPQLLDTIDPDIGLVREFRITGKIYARYEVWKQWDADPDAARLARRQQNQCEDVSMARAGASPGTVWRLRSVGYIFNLVDATVPFNVAPNSVIASQVAVNEVRRLVIGLPGLAAVNVGDGNSCHINTNGRIVGNTAGGIYYPAGSGTPTTGPANANRVTGNPRLSTAVDYDDSYEGVFGVSFSELQAMATLVVTDPTQIPSPMPDMGLIIIDCGNVTIDDEMPLTGSGIVIIRGNTHLVPDNNSNFSGLLYVDGSLTVRAPSVINGSVICTGNMSVQGAADYATINFDGEILEELMTYLGNYRVSNTTLLPRHAR